MHWTDTAIILSARKHGENNAVLRVLSQNHGVYAGVMRGIHSKANRGIVQPGNVISATWQARLSEQLGTFRCELLEAHAAHLMQDAARLAALSAVCAIMEASLPERHPYARLYTVFHAFLETLKGDTGWPETYVTLELELLGETGFGLDLNQCAATGTTEDLIYVSPKSGRAVCREAGEPYKEKLLPLPAFLCHPRLVRGSRSPHKAGMTEEEILAGLQLTGYFLEHWLLSPHNRKLPAARERLLKLLSMQDA